MICLLIQGPHRTTFDSLLPSYYILRTRRNSTFPSITHFYSHLRPLIHSKTLTFNTSLSPYLYNSLSRNTKTNLSRFRVNLYHKSNRWKKPKIPKLKLHHWQRKLSRNPVIIFPIWTPLSPLSYLWVPYHLNRLPGGLYEVSYGTTEESLRLTMKTKKCPMYTAKNVQLLLSLLQSQI